MALLKGNKIVGLSAASVMALAFAGSAWAAADTAGDLYVGTKTVIPAEAAATMKADRTAANDGAVGTAVVAGDEVATTGIQYVLGASYVNNDTITFTASANWCTPLAGEDFYLATQSDTVNNDNLTPSPNGRTPFGKLSVSGGVITFRVTDDTAKIDTTGDGDADDAGDLSALAAGTKYYLVTQSDPDTATGGTLDTTIADDTANPCVSVSSLTTPGAQVTLEVGSKTSTGVAMDTSGDKSEVLVESATEFTAAVATAFNGIIDVDNDRARFTVADPNASWDLAKLTLNADSGGAINTEQIATDASDTLVVTITGSMTGIDKVFVDVNCNGAYNDGTDINATLGASQAVLSIPGDDLDAAAACLGAGSGSLGDAAGGESPQLWIQAVTNDANFDGTIDATPDALSTRSFSGTARLNLSTESAVDSLLTDTSFGAWTINGWQGTIPYVNGSSWVRLCNDDANDAEVFVELTQDDGTTESATMSDVPGGGCGLYFMSTPINSVGFSQTERLKAILTVTSSTDEVHATGFMNFFGKDRELTIYENTDNSGTTAVIK